MLNRIAWEIGIDLPLLRFDCDKLAVMEGDGAVNRVLVVGQETPCFNCSAAF